MQTRVLSALIFMMSFANAATAVEYKPSCVGTYFDAERDLALKAGPAAGLVMHARELEHKKQNSAGLKGTALSAVAAAGVGATGKNASDKFFRGMVTFVPLVVGTWTYVFESQRYKMTIDGQTEAQKILAVHYDVAEALRLLQAAERLYNREKFTDGIVANETKVVEKALKMKYCPEVYFMSYLNSVCDSYDFDSSESVNEIATIVANIIKADTSGEICSGAELSTYKRLVEIGRAK